MPEQYTNTLPERDGEYMTREEVTRLIDQMITNFAFTSRVQRGYIQSKNYVAATSGWRINASGTSQFNQPI